MLGRKAVIGIGIGAVLVLNSFAATRDTMASIPNKSDSIATNARLKTELSRRVKIGQALSITGLSLNAVGMVLPWLYANPTNVNTSGAFLGTGLGMVTVGSTIACVGTTVISKWSSDHVMDPPETRAWFMYKLGMGLMYASAVCIFAGIAGNNVSMLADYGVPAFFAGQTLLLISSIQSTVFTSSVKSKLKKNEFRLVAFPTINLHKGAGCVLQLTFN